MPDEISAEVSLFSVNFENYKFLNILGKQG